MNKKLKWILIVVGLLIGVFAIAKVVGGKDNAIKVSSEKASKRTIIETVTASGNIYPEVEVKISPDISGEITELNVEEGDSVKTGDILARVFADIGSYKFVRIAERLDGDLWEVKVSPL